MHSDTETFKLSLTERETAATGETKKKRVDGSLDRTGQFVWLGKPAEFEPLLACGDAARMLGNIHVKTLQRYATHLKANGEDVKVVQESLRHANSRITLDTCSQALTPAKREAQTKVVKMILPERIQTAVVRGGT